MAWYDNLIKTARWIWHDGPRTRYDVALFYTKLTPPTGTAVVELHVTADNRYTLWTLPDGGAVPAMPLGRGPARGDVQHKSVDSFELETASPLHIYAECRWMPGQPESPAGEVHTSQPGFACVVVYRDFGGKIIGKTGSDKTWLAARCDAAHMKPMRTDIGYVCIGMLEHQHASGWPAGWLSPKGVSAGTVWKNAVQSSEPYFKPDPAYCTSPGDRPWIIDRQIAHPEQIPLAPFTIRDGYDAGNAGRVVQPDIFPLKLAPGETRHILFDLGRMVLGYASARLAGKGTEMGIEYAEVLIKQTGDTREKSFDPASGFALLGFADRLVLDVDRPQTLHLWHWRSFRFIRFTVTAGPQGGTVESINVEGTGYPFENISAFEAEGEHRDIIAKTVDVSWRTLKCCTWETYMDCPFYEQMQYIGDTRLQCLITYVTTGDPTLPAQALRAFDRSRIYEGLTQSRYPSSGMQLIPTFSLIYILMIEDYLNWVGDEGLVAEVRPGIAPILNWFSQFTDQDTGLVTMPTYWPFVDWVAGWGLGNPPAAPNREGKLVSSLINLILLLALDAASRIYDRAKPGSGNLYATRANVLRQKIYDTFYHAPTGLIADIPVDDRGNPATGGRATPLSFSQHAQALATLTDVLNPAAARKALAWAMDPDHISTFVSKGFEGESITDDQLKQRPPQFRLFPASFYFRYYVAEALAKVGMGDQLWPLLSPFFDAVRRGSTTWPESFEPCRSECHAWTSWPLYFFHRHVLGVHPPDLADGQVTIAPLHCPPLNNVRGMTATHRGPVGTSIDWKDGKPVIKATGQGVRVRMHHAS